MYLCVLALTALRSILRASLSETSGTGKHPWLPVGTCSHYTVFIRITESCAAGKGSLGMHVVVYDANGSHSDTDFVT